MKINSKDMPHPHAMDKISLRPVENKDCRIIWQWANNPTAREASFSSQPIPWEDHVKWFELKRKDSNCIFYVIDQFPGMLPVGTIRYDMDGDHAVISINIALDQRQKYIGSRAVMLSEKNVFGKATVEAIHAFIKTSNIPSINMFTRLGYVNAGTTLINNIPAYNYTKERNHY